MTIEQEIENWDGKSSSDITAIYQRYCNEPIFVSSLLKLIRDKKFQNGATWLLKHYLDDGHRLAADQVAVIYQLIPAFVSWESKLHILQGLPYMPIAETEKNTVETFLRNCLIDNNKFIRAWAYHGFYEISLQYPEYREETRQFFEMAMRDEAPSVKARIRNILKKGF